jgi:hypothetical protein
MTKRKTELSKETQRKPDFFGFYHKMVEKNLEVVDVRMRADGLKRD